MVAFAEPRRPPRRAYAPQCVGSSSCANPLDQPLPRNDRNQQYSITALTNGSGTIVERYAYTAYGQPKFFDGSGTAISASAESNRYTYTGREWDQGLSLYHYRARMYDATAGRFSSRDPIAYGFAGSVVTGIDSQNRDERISRIRTAYALAVGSDSRADELATYLRSAEGTEARLEEAEQFVGAVSSIHGSRPATIESLNLYEYVHSRPLIATDPTGEWGIYNTICLITLNQVIPIGGSATQGICFGGPGCTQGAVSTAAAACNMPTACCTPANCIPLPSPFRAIKYVRCIRTCIAAATPCRVCF